MGYKFNPFTGTFDEVDGSTGPTGPTGPSGGPTGPTGAASTVPGPTGPASTVPGPTGPTGAASTVPGPTGPISTAPGPTGPTGAASTVPGPTGPQGDVGMYWRGTWDGATTYIIGDGVYRAGVAYISLVDNNLGIAPESDPLSWDIFAQGGVGPTGPTGAVSMVPGPTGPPGNNSTVPGPTGPAGPTGADSTVPGPTGADSVVPGPTGPAGPTGAASTVAGPTGPASTVPGPTGPTGAPGLDSSVPGPTGGVGPTGAASTVPGPTGPVGITWVPGGWDIGTTYATNQAVEHDFAAWISLVDGNVGIEPGTDALSWDLIVDAPAGPTGPTGASSSVPGPTGPASTVAGPTGPTGTPGLDSVVPGPTGAGGPTGPTGAASTVAGPTGPTGVQGASFQYIGTWDSGVTYALGNTVLYQGSTFTSLSGGNIGNNPVSVPASWGLAALGNVTGPAGPTGPTGPNSVGPTGPTGATPNVLASIEFVIDGAGAAITTGVKGDLEIPFNCTITGWTVVCDQSGSIVIDVWKDTYANFPPVVGDSITASAKPTVSAALKGQSSTLTGWTTSVTAGDIMRFNVDSITTVQRATLSLKVTRT